MNTSEEADQGTVRSSLRRAVTLTAVITFLATTLGAYGVERVADTIGARLTSDLAVEVIPPYAPDLAVVVPSTVDLTLVKAPNDSLHVTRWALNNGGAPAGHAETSLTVWGTKDRPTILRGVRATDVRCQAASGFTSINGYGGGDIGERLLTIDLDAGDHEAVPTKNQLTGELFTFPLQVSPTDVERFRVNIATATSDCRFRLEIGYERRGTVRYVPVNHETYRVVSAVNAEATYSWQPRSDGDETLVLRPA